MTAYSFAASVASCWQSDSTSDAVAGNGGSYILPVAIWRANTRERSLVAVVIPLRSSVASDHGMKRRDRADGAGASATSG